MSEFDNADDGTDDDLDNGEQQATEPLVFRIEQVVDPDIGPSSHPIPGLAGSAARSDPARSPDHG